MNIQTKIESIIPASEKPSDNQTLSEPTMPLRIASQGQKCLVQAIAGDKSQSRRLADIGLRVGKTIRVIQKNRVGIVVGIQGLRLAIGPSQANKIFVVGLA